MDDCRVEAARGQMSAIFVSYKREDEARVHRLVRALESVRLKVWWDRELPGGENWSSQIQDALSAALCVIVVWTKHSVGPRGDFVRDEARQGKGRGILVPVFLDKVNPPLGFGEIQSIDLTHWKGSPRDPFFQDLVATVAAKLEGLPAPTPKGPLKRLARRLTLSAVSSAILFVGLAFSLNLFRVQERVCTASLLIPSVSDACGAVGLGNRPTRDERLVWERRATGDCGALAAYLARFPDGAYRSEASSLLAARQVTRSEVWTAVKHRLALFVRRDDEPSGNQGTARSRALMRAQPAAERLCKGFAASKSFRLRSAKSEAQVWDCGSVPNGVSCGFEGEAVCDLEERTAQERESCGN